MSSPLFYLKLEIDKRIIRIARKCRHGYEKQCERQKNSRNKINRFKRRLFESFIKDFTVEILKKRGAGGGRKYDYKGILPDICKSFKIEKFIGISAEHTL